MPQSNRKRSAIGVVAVILLLVGGAYAYWTVAGGGTGSGTTAEGVAAITVNQTSTVTNLYPGGPAQALSGTFTNTNPGPVYVGTVTASIASVTKASGAQGTCDASDYTLTGAAMTVNAEVPSGTGGAWTGATLQFNNKATNQDGCKGATVNLAYAIS